MSDRDGKCDATLGAERCERPNGHYEYHRGIHGPFGPWSEFEAGWVFCNVCEQRVSLPHEASHHNVPARISRGSQ